MARAEETGAPVRASVPKWRAREIERQLRGEERRERIRAVLTILLLPLAVAAILHRGGIPALVLLLLGLLGFAAAVLLALAQRFFVALIRWVADPDFARSPAQRRSLLRALLDHLRPALLPTFTGEDGLRRIRSAHELPWLTAALIASNAALFYLLDAEAWRYLGREMGALRPHEMLSALFVHGDAGHLWGNMLFLWCFGSLLERRIDRRLYFLWFLAGGIAADLAGELMVVGLPELSGERSIGASGAIATLMGLAVVRCHAEKISLGIPLPPLFGCALPLVVRIGVGVVPFSAIYLMQDWFGLFRALEGNPNGIGYWAHVGGYLAGVAIALHAGLFRAGLEEKRRRRALDPIRCAGLVRGRAELSAFVARNPGDLAALLELARREARAVHSDAGCELYRRALELAAEQQPQRVAEIYQELFQHYAVVFPPARQLVLARALRRREACEPAARGLEDSLRRFPAGTAEGAAERDRALFELGALYLELDLSDCAERSFEELLSAYPGSEVADAARFRLDRLRDFAGSRSTACAQRGPGRAARRPALGMAG